MSNKQQELSSPNDDRRERISAAIDKAKERMKTKAQSKLDRYHSGQLSREEYYATDSSDDDVDPDITEEVDAARIAEIPLTLDELANAKANNRIYREENLALARELNGDLPFGDTNLDDPDLPQKYYREELAKLQDRWEKYCRNEITRAEFFDSSDDEQDEPKPLPAKFLASVAADAVELETKLAEYRTHRCLGTYDPTHPSEPYENRLRFRSEVLRARKKLQQLANGSITVDDYLESSDDDELAQLTTIGPTDEDTLKTAAARMNILDVKRSAKHETLKEVLTEVAAIVKNGTLPIKTEPESDPSDDEFDNSYDIHEDCHRDYPHHTRTIGQAKGSKPQPPRPKKPEPTLSACMQQAEPSKKKTYTLRDRKKIDKPKRLSDYVTTPEPDSEKRKKESHQGAVVNVPLPGPSSSTQPEFLHMCSHGVITGPGTVDLTFYVRGYKPGSDEPVTIKIT